MSSVSWEITVWWMMLCCRIGGSSWLARGLSSTMPGLPLLQNSPDFCCLQIWWCILNPLFEFLHASHWCKKMFLNLCWHGFPFLFVRVGSFDLGHSVVLSGEHGFKVRHTWTILHMIFFFKRRKRREAYACKITNWNICTHLSLI